MRAQQKTEDIEGSPLSLMVRARCDECGDCWLWRGSVQNKDTPVMRVQGSRKLHPVRRLLLADRGVKIGARCGIAKCETPRCVRPTHCKAATRGEVQQRATDRLQFQQSHARNAKLSASSRRRGVLSPEQVNEARTTTTPQKVLADRWGCAESVVWAARNFRTYRDYGAPFAAIVGALA